MTADSGGVIEARAVGRRFGSAVALEDVSLSVPGGRIHALLGPNGAGKTTLLRVLAGLVQPTSGSVSVLGYDSAVSPRELRQRIGYVPAGNRSFYLRLSGLENLVFFARLYGLRRGAAARRAGELLERVGLAEAVHRPVGQYSHGMQKRLAVARAFLLDAPVLLVDEATHELDPEGARRVRDLVAPLAAGGAAVVWATQRLDEIRGFAGRVTVLHRARVRFEGTVAELVARAAPRAYVVHLRNGRADGAVLVERLRAVLGEVATIAPAAGDVHHFMLGIADGANLGDALARVLDAGVDIVGCAEATSGLEAGFLRLTSGSTP